MYLWGRGEVDSGPSFTQLLEEKLCVKSEGTMVTHEEHKGLSTLLEAFFNMF